MGARGRRLSMHRAGQAETTSTVPPHTDLKPPGSNLHVGDCGAVLSRRETPVGGTPGFPKRTIRGFGGHVIVLSVERQDTTESSRSVISEARRRSGEYSDR
jgi:hypothetical protein